jgi:fucose permease
VVVTAAKFVFAWAVLDEFNNAGTMGAFGFLGAYFLISLAAPAFLKKRGELRARDIGMCVAAVVLMIIPAVGMFVPLPDPPVRYFPYAFGVYLFFGYARVMAMQHQKAKRLEEIQDEVEKMHATA